MVDYIEALRNLKPGESLVIPVTAHRAIRVSDRIPETTVERVDKLQVRHVFVAPLPDEPPPVEAHAPPEPSLFDPEFVKEIEREDIIQEALARMGSALRARIAELETIPEPTPEPEPESHFADLMLADETIDDAKARLSQRLRELRHYLIAPEIKVNEDGSVGLTAGEQSELQDLERRQTLGRWLEA